MPLSRHNTPGKSRSTPARQWCWTISLTLTNPCHARQGVGGKGPASQAEHLPSGSKQNTCWGLLFAPGGGCNLPARFGWPAWDSRQGTAHFAHRGRWRGERNGQWWSRTGAWCWPYACPHHVPHSRSWLLVPNPSSQQHQRPPESRHEPPWLFSKGHLPLLLVSVCKCNYPKTYIYIYISRNLSQMSRRWLCSGLARAVQAAARDGEHARRSPCTACGQAGIALSTTAFVSGLPLPARRRQPGSNLGHAEVFFREPLLREMLWKDATLKPTQSPRIVITVFIKAVYKAGT